jgi:hypothetical protein
MTKKIRPFDTKLLTWGSLAWFNRASLKSRRLKVVGGPFRTEGNEFPLDTGRAIGYE